MIQEATSEEAKKAEGRLGIYYWRGRDLEHWKNYWQRQPGSQEKEDALSGKIIPVYVRIEFLPRSNVVTVLQVRDRVEKELCGYVRELSPLEIVESVLKTNRTNFLSRLLPGSRKNEAYIWITGQASNKRGVTISGSNPVPREGTTTAYLLVAIRTDTGT